jgi:TrbL/VirB6 plasmid conjugal transfer protein
VGPDDLFNPFKYLAGEAGKVIADGWTSAMLGLWNAGLWALRLVLNVIDALLTPDLGETGPGGVVYRTTFWLAGALLLIMLMIQLGLAVIRRSGKSLAAVLVGLGQFLVVWGGWVGFGVAVVYACGGLTRALMKSLLNVTSWSSWQPWAPFSVDDITDGTVATVLGLMGLLLWLAAIGHLLVMITRSAALIVLAAATPVAAAGLVSDAGRTWFWKSLRWFLAAAFTPVPMVLVLGIGVQITTGVANGLADKTQQAIGTALPGVILILIACVAPVALFKLLAFVDPNTSSGAALRSGLADVGGVRRLFAGGGDAAAGTGGDASEERSQGEEASEDATGTRLQHAQAGLLHAVGGPVGSATASSLRAVYDFGSRATAIGSDLTNQMGVGHMSYHPDLSHRQTRTDGRAANGSDSNHDGDGDRPDDQLRDPGPAATSAEPAPLAPSKPFGMNGATTSGGVSGGVAEVGGSGAAAGGAEAAAAVPIVPV